MSSLGWPVGGCIGGIAKSPSPRCSQPRSAEIPSHDNPEKVRMARERDRYTRCTMGITGLLSARRDAVSPSEVREIQSEWLLEPLGLRSRLDQDDLEADASRIGIGYGE